MAFFEVTAIILAIGSAIVLVITSVGGGVRLLMEYRESRERRKLIGRDFCSERKLFFD